MKITEIVTGSRESEQAYRMFSQSCKEKEMLHLPLSRETFEDKFLKQKEEMEKITLLLDDGIAFASGVVDHLTGKLFVTMVITDKSCRRKGFGRAVLSALEKQLMERGHKTELEISFFNPVGLPWGVPGKEAVTHPNTPGVDIQSDAYIFLKNCGYRDFAMQNSYYLNLSDYQVPDEMDEKSIQLSEEGFSFTFFDPSVHRGMEKMMQDFQNPLWEKEILNATLSDSNIDAHGNKGGRPILVPVYQGRVCGFAGPLDVEESKRGYFAGIGIDEAFRGKGLAKVLFCFLCSGLKEKGAEYMTLFTGENNPARNIYESVGFSIIHTWADMRKRYL
ncbi:GNAT family N-acetyltransferase [Robinsoniella peoriensis]|uniref:GNAT family N-acetyltransferase n=1 Tax=Robinsoniella peoriensis TaxID=180332 RepID=UPI0036350FFB